MPKALRLAAPVTVVPDICTEQPVAHSPSYLKRSVGPVGDDPQEGVETEMSTDPVRDDDGASTRISVSVIDFIRGAPEVAFDPYCTAVVPNNTLVDGSGVGFPHKKPFPEILTCTVPSSGPLSGLTDDTLGGVAGIWAPRTCTPSRTKAERMTAVRIANLAAIN
jgi:hypothetical protein